MIRKLVLAAAALVAALVVVLVIRTAAFRSRQVAPAAAAPVAVDTAAAAARLAAAIRIPTISHEDAGSFDAAAFEALIAQLRESFPLVHAALATERVAGHSLLYTWRGTDTSLAPVVLMGHLDVVPVEPGTESQWTHPPFAGRIADGYIWGRGALDDKAGVLSTLEAVEGLLARGYTPRRTVHLAFGHDEEVGGRGGAGAIAALLRQRGVQPAVVVDEGGVVLAEGLSGIDRPVAAVGIAEKGFLSVRLVARDSGGHSSSPPRHTAIGRLAGAVARLEEEQLPARLDGATREMLGYLGPEMSLPQRLALANLWLFGPLVRRQFTGEPKTAAVVRTTTAPTIFRAGVKDNVLPSVAEAVVNFRLLPGDSAAEVVEHVRRVVDDPAIEVEVIRAVEASDLSPTDAAAFLGLQRAIAATFPEAVIAPYLTIGGTDARHFAGWVDAVYRFEPLVVTGAELRGMHGTDERIAVANYARGIAFKQQLIDQLAGAAGVLATP